MTTIDLRAGDHDFVAYAVGLVYASACTSLPDDQAAQQMNMTSPAPSGWAVAAEPFADGTPNPTPCPDNPETHRHVLFVC